MKKQLLKKCLFFGATLLLLGNNAKAQCGVNAAPPNGTGCGSGDLITFFSINSIASPFSPGCSAGSNGVYTTTPTWTIQAGASTTFSANMGASFSQGFGIWIDLDKDGFYNTTTEQVFNNNPFLVHANTFTIPLTVASGTYNLRARCAYNVTQTSACSASSFGESENYIVFINNGEALNFDGANDRVNLGSSITTSLTGSTKLTVEARVRTTFSGNLGNIVSNYGTNNGSNLQFLLRRAANGPNGNFEFFVGNGPTWPVVATTVNTSTNNVWMHVAGTWDGSVSRLYINGVLSGTATTSIPVLGNAGGGEVWIGGSNVNEYNTGSVDEVRIWNRALCQGEIQNNMMGQLSLPQSSLVAYYQFNQGIAAGSNPTVTTLNPIAGPTGTLVNMTLNGATSNWVSPGGVSSTSNVAAFISPTLAIASPTAICNGSSTTLTASGVSSYTWTSGPTTATFAVTPSVTTTYSVIGTNSVGCLTNVNTRTINVNVTPTVAINNTSVCGSATAALNTTVTGTGPYTYVWSTGAITSSITGLPATYVATVTAANGCVGVNSATITSNPIPTVSANNGTICNGNTFTIVPSGASTYTIEGGNAVVSPTSNASYTVIGTSSVGCVSANTATSSVTVNANPTVTTVSNASLICNGQTATLTASGANTYTWNTAATTSVIAVSPSVTTSYTVTGSGANGCTNAITITQSVSACTGINANQLSNTIISVYPNPSNGEFTISTDTDMNLSIVNNLGQVVKEISINSLNNYKVSVSNLANGIYFVVGKNTDQSIKTKIIVSK